MYLKRLKDLRKDHDLKQKNIAQLLNISQQYYIEYELGKVSTDYILELSDIKKRR